MNWNANDADMNDMVKYEKSDESLEQFPSVIHNMRLQYMGANLPPEYDFDALVESPAITSWYDDSDEEVSLSWEVQLRFDEEYHDRQHKHFAKKKATMLKTVIVKFKSEKIILRRSCLVKS